MAVTINAKGTTESTFAIGKQGPKLKNNSNIIEVRNTSDTDYVGFRSAGLTDNATATAITITSDSNVGIGVSPIARLHVVDNGSTTLSRFESSQNASVTMMRFANSNAGADALMRMQFNNNFANGSLVMSGSGVVDTGAFGLSALTLENDAASGIRLAATNASGDIKFYTAGSGTSNERMIITNAGLVGINQPSPDGQLHIQSGAGAGAVVANGNADELIVEGQFTTGMSFLSPSATTQNIFFGDAADNDIGQIKYEHGSNSMSFVTNTSENMRIFSTGEVAMGDIPGTPNGSLHVQDSTATIIAGFYRDTNFGDSTQDVNIEIGNSGANQGSLRISYFNNTVASGQIARIDFRPRNAADTGFKQGGQITFTNDPDTSGEIRIGAVDNSSNLNFISLDGDDLVLAPLTTSVFGLGRTGKRWRDLWLSAPSPSVPVITALADSASFTDNVLEIGTDTVAGSGFNHIICNSDVDGTIDPVFRVQGDGLVFADGAYSGSGADYADYFEWEDGNPNNEDRVGCSVALTASGKIRVAISGENPIGVISGRPSVAGNAAADSWANKYLKDDYNRYILDDNGAKTLNPDYDPDTEYTPRPDRIEWDAVGLVGRLPVNKGQVTSMSWTKIKNISGTVEEWLVTGGKQIHVMTWVDEEIVPLGDDTLTEEIATEEKMQELSTLFYFRLSEGFVWNKETFDVDERAQHNIGVEFMFQAQAIDDFPTDFSWRGFQNQEVAMDYHQFMDFAKASRAHVKEMRAVKAFHEKSINRKRLVKSIMECDISKGWPKSAVESLSKKK